MSNQDIYALAETAEAAQVQIQARCSRLDPVVGVSRKLREAGFPIDLMTIDCLQTGKRISLLVNDDKPGLIAYQRGFRDQPTEAGFTDLAFAEVSVTQLCIWIRDWFTPTAD